MLFQGDRVLDPNVPIRVILVLPSSVAGEPLSRVRCDGQTVRAVLPRIPSVRPAIAATVRDYLLAA